jgi:protein-S-isoprenylcysteine O-methyltransferase Ste14
MTVVSVLGFLLMVAGILGLLATHSLFSMSPLVIGLQGAAAALMLWARITFGRRSFHATAEPTEGGLVTSGPYRFVRHPIYSAVVLFCLAGAAAHLSLRAAALALVILVGALARMLAEEGCLRARYPDYADYAARTKRMLPRVF